MEPRITSWKKYLKRNLTDDEGQDDSGDDNQDDVEIKKLGGRYWKMEDVMFLYNAQGEPILPPDGLQKPLPVRKNIVRSFVKAHYGEILHISVNIYID